MKDPSNDNHPNQAAVTKSGTTIAAESGGGTLQAHAVSFLMRRGLHLRMTESDADLSGDGGFNSHPVSFFSNPA